MRKATSPCLAVCIALGVATLGCQRHSGLPAVGSEQYAKFMRAFYVGLGGLQSGEDLRARQYLEDATNIAPGEPASWTDLGLLQARQQQWEAAFHSVSTARGLLKENGRDISRIETLLGVIESRRGNAAAALAHFRSGATADPKDAKAVYALAQETERQGGPQADANARQLLEGLLQLLPNNTAVLVDVARLSAKLGDLTMLERSVASLQAQSRDWPDRAKQQLAAVLAQMNGASVRSAAVQLQFLRNVLLPVPEYRRSQNTVKIPAAFAGEPFERPLLLPSPDFRPAPADTSLRFDAEPISAEGGATWAGVIVLDDKAAPLPLWVDRGGIRFEKTIIPLPAAFVSQPGAHALLTADFNYDFKTDIAVATRAGFRLFQQGDARQFHDVTAQTRLPANVLNGEYTGAWAFDVDLDGDLDIVLGSATGHPTVLRNNGDGTFAAIEPFGDIDGVQDFAAADLDADGAPDVALLDGKGRLHVLMNERLGQFAPRPVPSSLPSGLQALTSGDVNGDGSPDLVVLQRDGKIVRLSDQDRGHGWQVAPLVSAPQASGTLALADLDNNGALDLVVGDRVYLQDANGFAPLASHLPGACHAAADFNDDGRVDAVCLQNSSAIRSMNRGAKQYHWQTVRLRAAKATGDQRINSFGIGGEVEIRAGLLTEKQSITSPVLHFGLGTQTQTDLARIVWPNGAIQVEFSLKPEHTILAEQRLKGSCPFLFAWDGARMHFVKDCAPWSRALGLHINAQQVAGISETQEWFKIPAGEFAEHNGSYDFRITAEYWETFYIDHYSFLSVDHPAATEVFADERFAVPAPPLRLYFTQVRKPFASAIDQDGRDVAKVVAKTDAQYLDTFARGRYQGVAQDHWVELQLPPDAPESGPLYLIGTGWMHPTDATINVALGQGSAEKPHSLSIEVPDGQSGWRVARSGLGFPAGRLKTIVLPLEGLFSPGAPRRFRLRTNLEIYWDQLTWAAGVAESPAIVQRLPLGDADLRYRGFSRITQATDTSPELPEYETLAGTGQRWRDLEGYYTRFGDVKELLAGIDDRMVIANAGDEIALRVTAPVRAPAGWTRDLFLVGDGWIKDGDYNSTFSKTVLPLPYHGQKSYDVRPTTLESDPAYRAHPDDWRWFHTRYVTPESFVGALRP